MSRTYRFKNMPPPWWVFYSRDLKIDLTGWRNIHVDRERKEVKKLIAKWRSDNGWHGDFGKNPGYWNHDYTEVPNRRKERDLLKKIPRLIDYEESPLFPLAKKPYEYYW